MTDLFIKQVHLTDSNDTVELFLHDSSGKALYFDNCKDTVRKTFIVQYFYY